MSEWGKAPQLLTQRQMSDSVVDEELLAIDPFPFWPPKEEKDMKPKFKVGDHIECNCSPACEMKGEVLSWNALAGCYTVGPEGFWIPGSRAVAMGSTEKSDKEQALKVGDRVKLPSWEGFCTIIYIDLTTGRYILRDSFGIAADWSAETMERMVRDVTTAAPATPASPGYAPGMNTEKSDKEERRRLLSTPGTRVRWTEGSNAPGVEGAIITQSEYSKRSQGINPLLGLYSPSELCYISYEDGDLGAFIISVAAEQTELRILSPRTVAMGSTDKSEEEERKRLLSTPGTRVRWTDGGMNHNDEGVVVSKEDYKGINYAVLGPSILFIHWDKGTSGCYSNLSVNERWSILPLDSASAAVATPTAGSCSCTTLTLMQRGCDCGAFKAEALLKGGTNENAN